MHNTLLGGGGGGGVCLLCFMLNTIFSSGLYAPWSAKPLIPYTGGTQAGLL